MVVVLEYPWLQTGLQTVPLTRLEHNETFPLEIGVGAAMHGAAAAVRSMQVRVGGCAGVCGCMSARVYVRV